jgi:predicted ribosome quality control (RQC) complex YloA/Tae2 family protein
VFDVLTIAAIADELTGTILDGRIQRIGHIDRRTLGAEVYANGRRRTLILSADDRDPRLHLSATEPAIDVAMVTPLLLLLRKYTRGGIIIGIEQPPLERIVRLSIAKRILTTREENELAHAEIDRDAAEDDDAIYGIDAATHVHLYIEIMGRHSNIILVDDDGRIMESAKRVTNRMSRVRPIAPGIHYSAPPPLDRPDPRRVTAEGVRDLFMQANATGPLPAWLVRSFRGVSPQIAREIAFLATGEVNPSIDALPATIPNDIAPALRHLFEPMLTESWSPSIYREEGEAVAFAAIPMTHLAATLEELQIASISAAAEAVQIGAGDVPGRHDARKQRLLASLASVRSKVDGRLASLTEEASRAEASEKYRIWGDLIYAYLWQIEPGQKELVTDGLTIPLDPTKSAKENAQDYFERYRRGRNAGEHLPELTEKAKIDLQYLDQLELQIAQAQSFPDIEALLAEWERYRIQMGIAGEQKGGRPRKLPQGRRVRPLYDAEGNAIYIGRNGAQNDEVTFDIAGPNDTWLHARGVPGSHVIIRWQHPDGDERDETVEAAAALAGYYSSLRNSGQAEVDVTRRRFVRKIKGAGPGMVTYRNERTIAIRPASEEALASQLASANTPK